MKLNCKRIFRESILPAGRVGFELALFTFGITLLAGIARADLIMIYFDPTQTTPVGQTGSPPAAKTAANSFSLWGVQYKLTGGDNTGCPFSGGNSLCFGDTIGTAPTNLDLSLLSDPVLSGPLMDDVALTLTFAPTISVVGFDIAVGTLLDTSKCPRTLKSYNGSMSGCPANVLLYDASGSVIAGGTYQWVLPDDSYITEAAFSYSGPLVSQAVLTFPDAESAGTEFAVDNLTYQPMAPAPEPVSRLLFGLAIVALGCRPWIRVFMKARRPAI